MISVWKHVRCKLLAINNLATTTRKKKKRNVTTTSVSCLCAERSVKATWCLTWPSCRHAWNYSVVETSCQSSSKSSLEALRSGRPPTSQVTFPQSDLTLMPWPHLLSYRFEPRWKAASSSPKGPPPASLRTDALSGHDESTRVGRTNVGGEIVYWSQDLERSAQHSTGFFKIVSRRWF